MFFYTPNLILRSDSYKTSHWPQYPPGTQHVYAYLEARGGFANSLMRDEVVFFGLQYILKSYFSTPITMADIDEAEKRITAHMGPGIFNRAGWERIVNVHGGYLPLRIKAVPEGTVLAPLNVLMTIENTDPELFWLTNYMETLLLQVWYPITVASISRRIKVLIKDFLEKTGDPSGLNFKLHDFGYRGVSSQESAGIGGLAHLVNFMGTDTMIALETARVFYGEEMAGFSIPAAEHSTITSWGEMHEVDAYENMIKQFGDGGLYAVVSDSYDIERACDEIWGQMLKDKVLNAKATLVVRPDSGHPSTVVLSVVETLGRRFGFTVNEKGYRVLNKVRVIQGDGINYDSIKEILENLEKNNWSADNVAFGMGGALLQQMNRDTLKFAIKASSITRNGRLFDVYKDPKTDSGKRSKRGRLKLVKTEDGYQTFNVNESFGKDELRTVWENGKLLIEDSLATIRDRAAV